LPLSKTTNIRLYTTLQGYSSPGGPLYPPRTVRQVARLVRRIPNS